MCFVRDDVIPHQCVTTELNLVEERQQRQCVVVHDVIVVVQGTGIEFAIKIITIARINDQNSVIRHSLVLKMPLPDRQTSLGADNQRSKSLTRSNSPLFTVQKDAGKCFSDAIQPIESPIRLKGRPTNLLTTAIWCCPGSIIGASPPRFVTHNG